MIKTIVLVVFLFSITFGYTQKEKTKLKFYSIALSPIGIYLDNQTDGMAFNLDVALKIKNHIFKLSVSSGAEVDFSFFGPSTSESFVAYDIMYGKEFIAKKWLYFDLYGGVGYFNKMITIPKRIPGTGSGGLFNTGAKYEYQTINDRTVGFPLQTRIRFQTGKSFGLGIQLYTNINNVNTIFSTGFFIQWKFKKRN